MDTAKGIGVVVTNPEFADIVSLEGVAPTKNKCLPIVALPTTAGTAAETTINYVIIDEKRQQKMVCVDPNDIPAVAIVDAELMYSLPKGLTQNIERSARITAIDKTVSFLKKTYNFCNIIFPFRSDTTPYKYITETSRKKRISFQRSQDTKA